MNADPSTLWILGAVAACASGAWGWFSDKSLKIKEDDHNRKLRDGLAAERARLVADRAHLDLMIADAKSRLAEECAQAMKEIDARTAYVAAMPPVSMTASCEDGSGSPRSLRRPIEPMTTRSRCG